MTKLSRTEKINQSKYRQESRIVVGDKVLKRNKRTSKYQPYFSPDQYEVVEVLAEGSVVKIKREEDGKTFLRHPDDIKTNTALTQRKTKQTVTSQKLLLDKWRAAVMSGNTISEDDYHNNTDAESDSENTVPEPPHTPRAEAPPQTPRGHWIVHADGGRSPGRGRGLARGRPPGQKPAPQLDVPPEPQQFSDEDMPDLSPAVRRSKRVAQQKH